MRFSLYLAAALVALTNAIDLQSQSEYSDLGAKVPAPSNEVTMTWLQDEQGRWYKKGDEKKTALPFAEHSSHVKEMIKAWNKKIAVARDGTNA